MAWYGWHGTAAMAQNGRDQLPTHSLDQSSDQASKHSLVLFSLHIYQIPALKLARYVWTGMPAPSFPHFPILLSSFFSCAFFFSFFLCLFHSLFPFTCSIPCSVPCSLSHIPLPLSFLISTHIPNFHPPVLSLPSSHPLPSFPHFHSHFLLPSPNTSQYLTPCSPAHLPTSLPTYLSTHLSTYIPTSLATPLPPPRHTCPKKPKKNQ